MDAFDLAKGFRDFMEDHARSYSSEPSELANFFTDWAQEPRSSTGDLISATGGNYAMALKVWTIVVAWFYQRPEDFAGIRGYVTMPINGPTWPSEDLPHHLRMKLQGLPRILDEDEWNREVFERQCRD